MTITFLPYSDFEKTARCLDDQRLSSSKKEGWIILRALRMSDEPKYACVSKAGYCLMWKGYEDALVCYLNVLMLEWARRGKNNDKIRPFQKDNGLDVDMKTTVMPPWLGYEILHSYHRHALLAKNQAHYQEFEWKEDGKDYIGSYMWPVELEDATWILRWPKATKRDPIPVITVCASPPRSMRKREPRVVTPTTERPMKKRTKQTEEQTGSNKRRMTLRSDARRSTRSQGK
ncbi:cytoplasmic protein [Seminavis robusta]|uniref:Cytoplasmic protein n=1 Tax=Seminavis robusta TaxID=568900 RepID=A0A9N8DJU4_9STRA|nr:cytoplasmic protein [Seminavis robusta]|eukprot:Sro123_g059400.1 cytoplasmic protein (231) ;mRNA; r:5907-6599